jgi:hypothetical protein
MMPSDRVGAGRYGAAMTSDDLLLPPHAEPAANAWWGVVIAQSCAGRGVPPELPARARRRVGTWDMLLVEVADEALPAAVAALRAHMVPADQECWYAHLFRGEEMVVVYQDRDLRTGTDPAAWGDVLAHGRGQGIPEEQLDFEPRTVAGARERFGPVG